MIHLIITVLFTAAFLLYVRWSDMKVTRLRMRHQEQQIETMRNFLMKHIDIVRKIEGVVENPEHRIIMDEHDWKEMEILLESADDMFVTRIRKQFPELTEKDVRLFMLLRIKLPARSLAMLYGISEKSIKQKLFLYKAKVGLEGEGTSLRTFIENF